MGPDVAGVFHQPHPRHHRQYHWWRRAGRRRLLVDFSAASTTWRLAEADFSIPILACEQLQADPAQGLAQLAEQFNSNCAWESDGADTQLEHGTVEGEERAANIFHVSQRTPANLSQGWTERNSI